MTDPLFWLVLSFLFVTVSLTIVLAVAIPALKELARAARSAEKLFDTLRREFPPTLESIRLTGLEISDLTDEVSESVQSAGQVVKQVDQSLGDVRKQAQKVQSSTRSLVVGVRAAWKTFTQPQKSQQRRTDRFLPSKSTPEIRDTLSDNSIYPSRPSLTDPLLQSRSVSINRSSITASDSTPHLEAASDTPAENPVIELDSSKREFRSSNSQKGSGSSNQGSPSE